MKVSVSTTPMCRRLSWGVNCSAYVRRKNGALRFVDWTGVLARRNTLREFVQVLQSDAESALSALQGQLHKRRKKDADQT